MAYLACVALGAILGVVLMALVQANGKKLPWEAEDQAKADAKADKEQIEKERQEAHEAIETLTSQELSFMLANNLTVADVVRERTNPASPIYRGPIKPAEPNANGS